MYHKVLGPLLFNICINDLSFIIKQTNVCNYADDTTLYACNKSLNEILLSLEHDSMLAVRWFENNYMKLNEDMIWGTNMNIVGLK